MFFYLAFLILMLPNKLSIYSIVVSEFHFINCSFIGVFMATGGKNNNIKKIRTIISEIFLQIKYIIIIIFQDFLIFVFVSVFSTIVQIRRDNVKDVFFFAMNRVIRGKRKPSLSWKLRKIMKQIINHKTFR